MQPDSTSKALEVFNGRDHLKTSV